MVRAKCESCRKQNKSICCLARCAYTGKYSAKNWMIDFLMRMCTLGTITSHFTIASFACARVCVFCFFLLIVKEWTSSWVDSTNFDVIVLFVFIILKSFLIDLAACPALNSTKYAHFTPFDTTRIYQEYE